MQGLTLQQIKQMGGTPITPPPVQPQGQGLTLAQIKQMGGTPVAPTPEPQVNSLDVAMGKVNPDGTPNTDKGILPQAVDQIKSGFQQTQKGVQNPDVIAGGKDIIAGTLNEAGGAIRGVFSPIEAAMKMVATLPGASQALDAIKNHVINPTSEAISNIPAVQKFVTANPNAESNVSNAISIATALIGGNKAPEIKSAVTDAVDTAGDAIKNIVSSDGAPEFTPEELQTHLQGVADDWTKPTTINDSKYNNARSVLIKDPNIPTNLAKEGINPFTHINDRGNFETADTASSIRSDNGKLAQDNLRPALTTADYTTSKLPVSDLSPTPDLSYGITPGQSESITSAIKLEQEALTRKYPNGMSLIDQLNEKINYDKNGGYSKFKPESENIKAIANRSIANSLSENIKANVPDELGYDSFQKYLSSRYRMADYLDALDGKKVPVSAKLNLIRMGSRFAGATFLRHVIPGFGDLISSFAGYQMGRSLESYIETLTNPMRAQFLERMVQSNPEALQKLQKYMSDSEVQRIGQLKLPAGEPLGTSKNPIITPKPKTPTTFEAPAQKINREKLPDQLLLPAGKPGALSPNAMELGGITKEGYLVDNAGNKVAKPSETQILQAKKYGWSQNPKTGRFQKIYTSQ